MTPVWDVRQTVRVSLRYDPDANSPESGREDPDAETHIHIHTHTSQGAVPRTTTLVCRYNVFNFVCFGIYELSGNSMLREHGYIRRLQAAGKTSKYVHCTYSMPYASLPYQLSPRLELAGTAHDAA